MKEGSIGYHTHHTLSLEMPMVTKDKRDISSGSSN